MVDNIEVNVGKAVDHVEAAKTETKKAVRYQSKARKVRNSPAAQSDLTITVTVVSAVSFLFLFCPPPLFFSLCPLCFLFFCVLSSLPKIYCRVV